MFKQRKRKPKTGIRSIPKAERNRLFSRVRWAYESKTGRPSNEEGCTLQLMTRVISGQMFSQEGCYRWAADNLKDEKPRPRATPSVDFYKSRGWQIIRFEALRLSNGACALCGRSSRDHGIVLHVDHIKPRSLRPDLELDLSNLQALCEDCNMGKGNRDDTDWRTGEGSIHRRLDEIDWKKM